MNKEQSLKNEKSIDRSSDRSIRLPLATIYTVGMFALAGILSINHSNKSRFKPGSINSSVTAQKQFESELQNENSALDMNNYKLASQVASSMTTELNSGSGNVDASLYNGTVTYDENGRKVTIQDPISFTGSTRGTIDIGIQHPYKNRGVGIGVMQLNEGNYTFDLNPKESLKFVRLHVNPGKEGFTLGAYDLNTSSTLPIAPGSIVNQPPDSSSDNNKVILA